MSEPDFTKEAVHDRKRPCEVTFTVGEQEFQGTSMHFSERGMLIMCKQPAPLNAKGTLALRFPGFNHPVEMNAEVGWTNIYSSGDSFSPKGMGVRFLNIEREMERLLTELAEQYESMGSIYSCYYT